MIVTLVKRTRYCYATFPRTLCRVVTPEKENRNSYIKSGVTDTIETFIVPRIYSWLGRKDRVNPSKKTIDGGRDKAIQLDNREIDSRLCVDRLFCHGARARLTNVMMKQDPGITFHVEHLTV